MTPIDWHGLILDGKSIDDDALPGLYELEDLIPDRLKEEFEKILTKFSKELSECKYTRFTEDIDVIAKHLKDTNADRYVFSTFLSILHPHQKQMIKELLEP